MKKLVTALMAATLLFVAVGCSAPAKDEVPVVPEPDAAADQDTFEIQKSGGE